MNQKLIAPCGMNCAVCKAHLRDKSEENYCRGCNNNPVYAYCQKCKMRNCNEKKSSFCDCENMPCTRLKQLDKRYRTKYGMSMVENLEFIKQHGLGAFVKQQNAKYVTKKGIFCVHDKKYYEPKNR